MLTFVVVGVVIRLLITPRHFILHLLIIEYLSIIDLSLLLLFLWVVAAQKFVAGAFLNLFILTTLFASWISGEKVVLGGVIVVVVCYEHLLRGCIIKTIHLWVTIDSLSRKVLNVPYVFNILYRTRRWNISKSL